MLLHQIIHFYTFLSRLPVNLCVDVGVRVCGGEGWLLIVFSSLYYPSFCFIPIPLKDNDINWKLSQCKMHDARCKLTYNHFHNILRLFDVLPNFAFTISETKCNY